MVECPQRWCIDRWRIGFLSPSQDPAEQFYAEETRTVTKDNMISFKGNVKSPQSTSEEGEPMCVEVRVEVRVEVEVEVEVVNLLGTLSLFECLNAPMVTPELLSAPNGDQ